MTSTRERPTLAELRARVFKPPLAGTDEDGNAAICPAPGNVLARRWGRPAAVFGTWLAVRFGLSAHQVTLLALLSGIGGAVAIGTGSQAGFVAGVLLWHLAFWLDHVDGQVARWRRTAGLSGVYLDYMMHHAQALAIGFGLGYGVAVRTGDLRWALAGLCCGAGWLFLGLHNDCRYKAFFQRLKSGTGRYRVDAGSGGRRGRPASWPRRGRGVITWPAYKACEPHVVLLTLSALALLSLAAPSAWSIVLRAYLVSMAVAAPALAAARVARAVRVDSVRREFDQWFQDSSRAEPPRDDELATTKHFVNVPRVLG